MTTTSSRDWQGGQLVAHNRLNLSCGLTEFPLEILDFADSLEILDLSNNCLQTLPEAFQRLQNLKIVFFTNNNFQDFPAVLAACPQLSMVSFKGNQLTEIAEKRLPPMLRWLILTNNQLETLPTDIGHLQQLQKLMLSGNQLQSLPDTMANCHNLELIRLAANRLTALPDWLLKLPRLAWLAYGGNPCSPVPSTTAVPLLSTADICLEKQLGQGTSGVVYKGTWTQPTTPAAVNLAANGEGDADAIPPVRTIALKRFKSEMTSDGRPVDEIQAALAAGIHPNLVSVLGQLEVPPGESPGLIFSFIAEAYRKLGNPPSLDSCTRDTYPSETAFTPPVVWQIAKGIAAATAHLHSQGICHGDLYAHNILVTEAGDSILSDFGAASFYNRADKAMARSLQAIEIRAFGCLLEELLDRCPLTHIDSALDQEKVAQLCRLQQDCMHLDPQKRPAMEDILQVFNK